MGSLLACVESGFSRMNPGTYKQPTPARMPGWVSPIVPLPSTLSATGLNPPDQLRCRISLRQLDAHDPSTARLDDIASNDFGGCPVRSLDEHVGAHGPDDAKRCRFREERDVVHEAERGQHFGPLRAGNEGPSGPLQPRRRGIVIDRHDEEITESPCAKSRRTGSSPCCEARARAS